MLCQQNDEYLAKNDWLSLLHLVNFSVVPKGVNEEQQLVPNLLTFSLFVTYFIFNVPLHIGCHILLSIINLIFERFRQIEFAQGSIQELRHRFLINLFIYYFLIMSNWDVVYPISSYRIPLSLNNGSFNCLHFYGPYSTCC